MPENEDANVGAEQKIAASRETIRKGLTMISNVVHARQSEVGYWPEQNGQQVDYRTFFAELHSKVASAYETYKEERDPTHLIWIDPETGDEVEPGKGIPEGLATDLVDIVFDVLGFATNVGINIGRLAADVAVMRPISGSVAMESLEGEIGPDSPKVTLAGDDDEDFDLEAILGKEVQEAPESVEIETPKEDVKPEIKSGKSEVGPEI
jgi:hypothetical protein